MLANGWPVAVKHIIKNEHAETFLREVTSLSHVRHPNLVSLRGYCDGQDECFLVYEFCINGNLSEWLFGKYLYKETFFKKRNYMRKRHNVRTKYVMLRLEVII
jgi:serine/threonine protein kinase